MVRAGPAPYPLIYEPRRLPCHNRVYRLARGGGRAGGGGGVVGGEVGERVTRDVARRYLRPGRLFTKRSVGSRPCRMTPVDTRAFGRNLIVSFARHRESAPHTRLRGYVEKHATHEMEHHAPPRVQGDQTGDIQAIVPPIFRYATMTLNRVSRRVTLPANSVPPPPLSLSLFLPL